MTKAAREHLLMNLRLAEGIDLAAYEKRWGAGLDANKIAALASQGFVTREDGRLTATPSGRLLLNRVIEELLLGQAQRQAVEELLRGNDKIFYADILSYSSLEKSSARG